MLKLNSRYRGKKKTTDVLSFPLQQLHPGHTPRSAKRCLQQARGPLGDVVISVQQTRRQAREFGVSFGEELLRLLIHGVLHLLGYDHEHVAPRTAAAMRQLEARLASELVASDASGAPRRVK